MSRYGQVENENNAQFDRLSSTLAQFRAVNQDIHNIARESTLIDSLSEQMSSLYDGIRNSSQGLTRSMQSGHGVCGGMLA
ncbi:Protein transport protein SFT1 [Cyberlindnera fabianii]|uniref:Protein transport protein SFT1 n=1 Tax=Cyberlindnera fabianii TaxID=36022 RepID=A0A1V2L3Z6_CYBFA|nr:Protein transport protein SFT1 [Cyberlindnera fabianii]